jgi:hypothetical protein
VCYRGGDTEKLAEKDFKGVDEVGVGTKSGGRRCMKCVCMYVHLLEKRDDKGLFASEAMYIRCAYMRITRILK